jgi:hypothetical protein
MLLLQPCVPSALVTLQDMIDQSGFTSSKKAGDDSDWHFAGVILAHGEFELRSAVAVVGVRRLY